MNFSELYFKLLFGVSVFSFSFVLKTCPARFAVSDSQRFGLYSFATAKSLSR